MELTPIVTLIALVVLEVWGPNDPYHWITGAITIVIKKDDDLGVS